MSRTPKNCGGQSTINMMMSLSVDHSLNREPQMHLRQGRIPMLRGPRHMPGAGPLPFYASPLPPTFFPPSLFPTQPLSSISLSLFVQIFISSLLPIFLFFSFFSFFFQYLNAPPEGPAGPPETRGPRHVLFMPLRGSGTG